MARSGRNLLSWMKRSKRKLAAACLLGAAPAFAGCYGQFPLTRAVYRMNGNVENRVVRQVVFWVFVILPIYGGASFIDAIIFNLVEFWTGETTEIDAQVLPDGRTVQMAPADDGSILMTISRDGQVLEQVRFVRLDDGQIQATSPEGAVLGHVNVDTDGSINLTDQAGNVVHTIAPGA